jgi:hypothetical protein
MVLIMRAMGRRTSSSRSQIQPGLGLPRRPGLAALAVAGSQHPPPPSAISRDNASWFHPAVRSAEGHARHEMIACDRHTAEPRDRNGDVAMTLTAADGAIAIPRSRSPARPDLLLGRRASGATGRVPRSAREGSPSQMPMAQRTPRTSNPRARIPPRVVAQPTSSEHDRGRQATGL